jgi:HK97 family phage portal protein
VPVNPTPAGPTAPVNAAQMAVNPQMLTFFGRSTADLPPNAVVNEYAAMAIPAFYSGVRFIVETLASLPKGVFMDGVGVRTPKLKHPVSKILARSINPIQIPFVFWETLFHHAVVWGNGYAYVKRSANLDPKAIYNVSPEQVTPFLFLPEGEDEPQKWYFVRGAGADGGGQIVSSADMIHIPGLGFDGLCGYPAVYLLSETLEGSRNAARYGRKFLKKGTQVRGSIEIPGTMNKDQISELQDRIRRQHSGLEDTSLDTMVLTNGATFKNNTVPPEQSQLLETMNFNVLDVCRILRIPPHIVYELSGATWGNIEFLGIEVVKYSLRAWIEKAEEALGDSLLTEVEKDTGLAIYFAVDHLMRGDTATLSTTLNLQVNNGLRTVNEARRELDLAPDADPASDKLRVPINFPVPGLTDPAGPAGALPPPGKPPSGAKRKKNSAAPDSAAATFAKLLPLLQEAAARVDKKTEMAFERRKDKPTAERIPWANVFAEEQLTYAFESLAPAAAAIAAVAGKWIDVQKMATRYSGGLRKRGADGTVIPLTLILQETIDAKPDPKPEAA